MTRQVTHQTVKLGKGKHSSARDGACVMELASMLAGEAFTDHPRSVCVIAAFLRPYNDMLDDRRRQDLYEYASKCVGSAAGQGLERLRAQRLLDWAEGAQNHRWPATMLYRLRRKWAGTANPTGSGLHAIQAMRRISDRQHHAVLGLLDELLSIDIQSPREPGAVARPTPDAGAHALAGGAFAVRTGVRDAERRDLQRGGVV
jgi:hypothetical protein